MGSLSQGESELRVAFLRTTRTMTARDVTGFCALFSGRKWGNFLHIWGDFLTKLHRKPWRKMKILWILEYNSRQIQADCPSALVARLPVRKILVSVKFVSAILGPEMAASILWAPGKMPSFCRETLMSIKFLVLGGILGLGGGRGVPILFLILWARGFFWTWQTWFWRWSPAQVVVVNSGTYSLRPGFT